MPNEFIDVASSDQTAVSAFISACITFVGYVVNFFINRKKN